MEGLEELKRLAEESLNRSNELGRDRGHKAYSDYENAANPQAVLSLIAEIESLRKQLEEANEARHYNANTCVKLQDEIFELKRLMHG